MCKWLESIDQRTFRGLVAALSIGLTGTAAHAAPILTLQPAAGTVTAGVGETVGWGFTLENGSDFLVATLSEFIPASPDVTYTDLISPQFHVVGPGPLDSPVWIQAFDFSTLEGFGALTIGPGASPGSSIAGTLVLYYDLFAASPNDPGFDPDSLIVAAAELRVPIQVLVRALDPPQTPVPEPGTLLLVGGATVHFFVRRKRSAVIPSSTK